MVAKGNGSPQKQGTPEVGRIPDEPCFQSSPATASLAVALKCCLHATERVGNETVQIVCLPKWLFTCGSKKWYQSGTLANGTKDKHLRNPSSFILSHTHVFVYLQNECFESRIQVAPAHLSTRTRKTMACCLCCPRLSFATKSRLHVWSVTKSDRLTLRASQTKTEAKTKALT